MVAENLANVKKHVRPPLRHMLKFAPIIKKLNLAQKTVCNYPVARNWRQNTLAQLSFGLKFTPCVKKLKIVQKEARNYNETFTSG